MVIFNSYFPTAKLIGSINPNKIPSPIGAKQVGDILGHLPNCFKNDHPNGLFIIRFTVYHITLFASGPHDFTLLDVGLCENRIAPKLMVDTSPCLMVLSLNHFPYDGNQ